jgi:hypothetical protein
MPTEVRQIVFQHFDQIMAAWREHLGEHRGEQNKNGIGKGDRHNARGADCDQGSWVCFHPMG